MAYGASGTTITGSPPAVRCYNSASISINSAAATALTFDTNRFDPTAMHSTSVNTGRITFTSPGVYLVTAYVQFSPNATGYRYAYIRLNGATNIGFQAFPSSGATDDTGLQPSTVYKFAANDYVEVVVLQNSGGALNVHPVPNSSPEFSAIWMGLGT